MVPDCREMSLAAALRIDWGGKKARTEKTTRRE